MIRIRDMTVRMAGRVLFDQASATIPSGHRVGLTGRNGTGKTTLLTLLTGGLQPDQGSVEIEGATGRDIGMVRQEAPGGSETPIEFVLAVDRERATLLAQADEVSDPLRIAEIQTRLADIGAHAAPSRAARILAGLGFDEIAMNRPLSGFSGGWRMRVALAAVLFAGPRLLLLDEPTNHLDLEAALWLEAHLARYPGTLILVSHDRDLLNRVVTGILHIENARLAFYRGSYDAFERVREERRALDAATARKREEQRRHMQAFVDRFRYKASKARQAQSRLKALSRLEIPPPAASEPTTVFRFPAPGELAPPLVTMDRVSTGYDPGQPVLRGMDLRLDPDDRIGVLGRNGNGKSTLARLIAGRLPAFSGALHRARRLRTGYFAQHQIEDLDPDLSACDHLARLMPDASMDRVRARLGGFGLVLDAQTTPARFMSGGERARLAIACATHDAPHVLILDEPTNHLDIDARDALVQALHEFSGAVIVISHDRRILQMTVDRLWLVAGGTVRPFDGDLDEYAERHARAGEERGTVGIGESRRRAGRQAARRAAADRRRDTACVRRAARSAERRLDELAAERRHLVTRLADPETWEQAGTDGVALARRKKEIDREIEAAEQRWLEAAEALEAAERMAAE